MRASVSLGGPLNALSASPDGNWIVAGGRDVFQLIALRNGKLHVEKSLRQSKSTLNYSINDVKWNPSSHAILASATTSGSVVIWNLDQMRRKDRQVRVYKEHGRAANRVEWGRDPTTLISGSQDATVKLWDTRQAESRATISCKEPVRDVRFQPSSAYVFAAGLEHGAVKVFDARHAAKPMHTLSAHQGLVLGLDFHPMSPNLLACASRDRTITVWDLNNLANSAKPMQTVQTIASAAQVKWRPKVLWNLATCSSVVDTHVHMWSVERPHVPIVTLKGHKGVVTGLCFLTQDVLATCSKDGTVGLFSLGIDGERPRRRMVTQAISWNVRNECAAVTDRLDRHIDEVALKPPPKKSGFIERRQHAQQPAGTALTPFSAHTEGIVVMGALQHDAASLVEPFALNYRLADASVGQLCTHNAMVARGAGQDQIAQTWEVLKMLYGEDEHKVPVPNMVVPEQVPERAHPVEEESAQVVGVDQLLDAADRLYLEGESKVMDAFKRAEADSHPRDGAAEDEDDGPAAGGGAGGTGGGGGAGSGAGAGAGGAQAARGGLVLPQRVCERSLGWIGHAMLFDILSFYAERALVQISCSIICVLNEHIVDFVETHATLIERWFSSYIELLHRHELWVVASEVIRLCPVQSVRELSQKSTTVHINCSVCSRPLEEAGVVCRKCARVTNRCSICHMPVRGLFVWCQACGHGGHLDHMREWFHAHRTCPAGCGKPIFANLDHAKGGKK